MHKKFGLRSALKENTSRSGSGSSERQLACVDTIHCGANFVWR